MKIGLALGGGGVRGLAHIAVLEALEQRGLKPAMISGTSMGAIIGAIYASGIPAREMRARICDYSISKENTLRDVFEKRSVIAKWVETLAAETARGGFINPKGFLSYLFNQIRRGTFEELDIPLLVIATDFWSAEEVVFSSGELLPAIQASMAVPGVFAPVSFANRVLVDGGITNQVPFDHLIDHCDLTIAVDVSKLRNPASQEVPNALECLLDMFDIMQEQAVMQKLKQHKPDIYLRPQITDVRMLDFRKIEDVFKQAEPTINLLNRELDRLLAVPDAPDNGMGIDNKLTLE